MGVDMLLLDFQVHASAYLLTDIPTKEIIHCQMVGALKELEKLWLVVLTMRSMLDSENEQR
ncbi:unnamed protein product [Brassica oleracea var. botrytis]|uniref:Uncharacterized protein n=2 Tax=Brassica TaxID=3705 RepID=A0A3P6DYT0_BRAOL|nr:unnamed protein product [Brassica napus]CDY20578.1 BnaC07g12450D [Brassica napus]VDD36917.1 unnamed protein product [Brassica oleracea]